MLYMLDTNICIYIIKRKPQAVYRRLCALSPNNICISSIVVSELFVGVEKSSKPNENRDALWAFLSPFSVLDYGLAEAKIYGGVRAELERSGNIIGAYDMMIAAHAINLSAVLITNNIREFERVRGLQIENWAKDN
ncbi:type II toxin-antitoxin system VapC family toxin [Deferribacterales bacterium RsTz2092]|nr:tRNA(fMet)-specific endonuclease VapC [Deferribacterales bacterium]